jgi:FkbM family methyltransferase
MMRKLLKRWLYSRCPGFSGAFTYFGVKVFFPRNSLCFRAACDQGIFEHDNLRVLAALARPGSWLFDIGANIGLMAIPLLHHDRSLRVVSFEPSPNSLPSLQRTWAVSRFQDRWVLVPKAVGAHPGNVKFHLATAENSLFDGLRDTGRVTGAACAIVEMTTLDTEWLRLGRPPVSVIKCDIEGAEAAMLQGASECLETCRPALLIEWNAKNLAAFGVAPGSLIGFGTKNRYSVHAVPGLAEIHSELALIAHMVFTESFLLLPT